MRIIILKYINLQILGGYGLKDFIVELDNDQIKYAVCKLSFYKISENWNEMKCNLKPVKELSDF